MARFQLQHESLGNFSKSLGCHIHNGTYLTLMWTLTIMLILLTLMVTISGTLTLSTLLLLIYAISARTMAWYKFL